MSTAWRFMLGTAVGLGIAIVPMAPVDARQRGTAPVWRYDLIKSYPHDSEAFTQGLVFRDGFLYESTGMNGRSSLRRVALETGRVVQRVGASPGAADLGYRHRVRLRPDVVQAAEDIQLHR
jgi:glutamine cyclotransferase